MPYIPTREDLIAKLLQQIGRDEIEAYSDEKNCLNVARQIANLGFSNEC